MLNVANLGCRLAFVTFFAVRNHLTLECIIMSGHNLSICGTISNFEKNQNKGKLATELDKENELKFSVFLFQ